MAEDIGWRTIMGRRVYLGKGGKPTTPPKESAPPPKGGHSGGSASSSKADTHVEHVKQAKLEKVSHEEVHSLTGKKTDELIRTALPDHSIIDPSTVKVTKGKDENGHEGVIVSGSGPGGVHMVRSFGKENGELVMEATFLDLGEKKGGGRGSELFAKQVAAAESLGVGRIRTTAAGSANNDQNGYYTWPRLGYDGKIPYSLKRSLPDEFKSAQNVGELMGKESGRAWWKSNGKSFTAEFVPTKGSMSRKIFDDYMAARKKGS